MYWRLSIVFTIRKICLPNKSRLEIIEWGLCCMCHRIDKFIDYNEIEIRIPEQMKNRLPCQWKKVTEMCDTLILRGLE